VSVTVSTDNMGTDYDTAIIVYEVTGPNMCFADLTQVDCNDNKMNATIPNTSELTFTDSAEVAIVVVFMMRVQN